MPAGDSEPDQTSDPDVPQHAPFTAWPDSRGGYVVLDLRTRTPVAGPFPSVEWVIAEMDRLNAEHGVRITHSRVPSSWPMRPSQGLRLSRATRRRGWQRAVGFVVRDGG